MATNGGDLGGACDAVVVGAGPNGLAAAIALAREGLDVLVVEAGPTVGGGTRSAELTLPGFTHDICSAVHPMALASPFLRTLPLAEHGLELVQPPAPLAHPLDDGTAAVLERSVEVTGQSLGPDAEGYLRLMGPLTADADVLFDDLLGPLRWPRHPRAALRFGWQALRPTHVLARRWFSAEPARALVAGLAAHSFLPLEHRPSAAIALMLGIAGHAVGWPVARGGSQRIADAMASYLRSLGGRIVTGRRIATLDELPTARAILLDVTPRQLIQIAGHRLPVGYLRRLGCYISLRAGRLQARLGAGRPYPLAGGRVRPRRHGPPGRHAEGGCGLRARGLARRAPRAAVRARGAAEPVRPDAGTAWATYGLGLLPRPQQLDV